MDFIVIATPFRLKAEDRTPDNWALPLAYTMPFFAIAILPFDAAMDTVLLPYDLCHMSKTDQGNREKLPDSPKR